MKRHTELLALVFSLSLSGCAKYQYVTVSGDLKQNEKKEFVFENDSLAIQYTFSGLNGPVNVTVKNKIQDPLFVDWTRSALIINDEAFPYFEDKSIMKGSIDGYHINWSPVVSTTSGIMNGEIRREEVRSFIPPSSRKSVQLLTLDSKFFNLDGLDKIREQIHSPVGEYPVKRVPFNPDTSPLQFRSFLTVSRDPSFAKPMVFINEFWVSEVIETGRSPREFPAAERKDVYYKSEEKESTGIFVVILSAIAIALAAGL